LPHMVMSPGQKRYIHIPSRPAVAPAFNLALIFCVAVAESHPVEIAAPGLNESPVAVVAKLAAFECAD
jgi:hypothetical protein